MGLLSFLPKRPLRFGSFDKENDPNQNLSPYGIGGANFEGEPNPDAPNTSLPSINFAKGDPPLTGLEDTPNNNTNKSNQPIPMDSMQALLDHLKNIPKEEDYKPSTKSKIFGGIAGALDAYTKGGNVDAGYNTYKDVTDDGYRKAVEQYNQKTKGLSLAAEMDMNKNKFGLDQYKTYADIADKAVGRKQEEHKLTNDDARVGFEGDRVNNEIQDTINKTITAQDLHNKQPFEIDKMLADTNKSIAEINNIPIENRTKQQNADAATLRANAAQLQANVASRNADTRANNSKTYQDLQKAKLEKLNQVAGTNPLDQTRIEKLAVAKAKLNNPKFSQFLNDAGDVDTKTVHGDTIFSSSNEADYLEFLKSINDEISKIKIEGKKDIPSNTTPIDLNNLPKKGGN